VHHRWQIFTGVNDTGGKFALSSEYLREFKKFDTALMKYSAGTWGKLIHELVEYILDYCFNAGKKVRDIADNKTVEDTYISFSLFTVVHDD
jgi:hypothetical protein